MIVPAQSRMRSASCSRDASPRKIRAIRSPSRRRSAHSMISLPEFMLIMVPFFNKVRTESTDKGGGSFQPSSRLFCDLLNKALRHQFLDHGIVVEFLRVTAGGLIPRQRADDRGPVGRQHHGGS